MKLPDYWLPLPKDTIDAATRQSFDRLWQSTLELGQNPVIKYTLEAPKWQFLRHLADTYGIVFHGSGNSGIMLFEPRQSNDLNEFGNQKAVYASSDGIWAMFFAIIDRVGYDLSITNACIRLKAPDGTIDGPFYYFSVSQQFIHQKPWKGGTLYLLPAGSFIVQPPMQFGEYEVLIAQLASLAEVRPLARLPVAPGDFPFLANIRGHDDHRLQEVANALGTGAPLPE
jgi:hypothetical protein